MTLPERGWKGYGRPGHPYGLRVKFVPDRCGVAIFEWHEEVAEYRLRHLQKMDGAVIEPALVAYLEAIGRSAR